MWHVINLLLINIIISILWYPPTYRCSRAKLGIMFICRLRQKLSTFFFENRMHIIFSQSQKFEVKHKHLYIKRTQYEIIFQDVSNNIGLRI
jgi:membrane protein CcdC involved in cytochrome C biogenesis